MRKITAITAFLSLCAVFIFSVTTISTAEEPVLETKVIPLHIASVNYEPTEDISVMNMKDTEKKEELLPDEDIALIALVTMAEAEVEQTMMLYSLRLDVTAIMAFLCFR